MNDNDTHQPLDGPASLTFRRPSTPPEPIGTRRLTITASTFDGSESMVLVDREDFPVWADDDEPEPDPACVEAAARVRAAFASARAETRSPDAQAPHADAFTPEAGEAEPDDAKASQRGAQREGTPVLYPAERGRR